MAVHKVIDWVTSSFLGYCTVRSVQPTPVMELLYDITVEPSHEFVVKSSQNWLRTHNCVVDDPLSEQDLKAGNTSSLDVTYEWFRAGLRTRLMPGGRICVLHCLTGGTLVRLASGEDKPIRDVRPGDMVVSYKDSKYTAAKVIGWSNQGLDRVYTVALKSGNIIRGNWKHPLLVSFHGEEKWVTLKNLTPGMQLVSTKVAQTRRIPRPFEGCAKAATTKSGKKRRPLGGCSFESSIRSISVLLKGALTLPRLQQNPARASSATAWSGITKSTLTPQGVLSGTTGNGRVKFVLQKAVAALCRPKVFAVSVGVKPTTTRARPKARTTAQLNGVTRISKCNTESPGQLTTGCLQSKEGSVRYAGSLRMTETLPLSGKCGGSPWITAMLPERFVRYCVTPAISWLKNATRQIYYGRQLRILSATFDEVVSVTIGGDEEVFDIQVEGTESFLANGVVSHNTRWHARDLIGRLVKDAAMNPDADQYEVFEFPAILDTPNPVADPTALDFDPEAPATIQKSLWPEQWSLESLLRTKASMPAWQWNAQYMQTPTAQEAAVIKRDDIRWWPDKEPPKVDFTVQGWDTALTTKERSDYSVCQTWGVWTTDEGVTNVILLNRVKGKYEFPELKKVAFEQAKEWQPDSLIIETKASGQPLVDELRRSGVFVQEYSPGKGQDKLARMNAISDMYASHQVWFPETRWATEVVEELVAFPSGEHDDECFSAYTKISMADGRELSIINVQEGDFVATPDGPRRVLRAWCSNPNASVVRVRCSNGVELVGTANHPVYVPAKQAFAPLGELDQGDLLCTLKHSSTEGLTTVDTLRVKTSHCDGTSMGGVTEKMTRYIVGFGKTTMAQFRKGNRFITKMVTQVTTTLTIWSALRPLNMALCIDETTHPLGLYTNGSGRGRTEHQHAPHQQSTHAPFAEVRLRRAKQIAQSIVQSNAMTCSIAAALRTLFALYAAPRLRQAAVKLRAPQSASGSGIGCVKWSGIRRGIPNESQNSSVLPALCANSHSWPHALAPASVPKSARSNGPYNCSVIGVEKLPESVPVWALQVEGNPVFYANGVLVHNCDAMTLCLMRIRKGGLLKLASDHEDPEHPFAFSQKRAYY